MKNGNIVPNLENIETAVRAQLIQRCGTAKTDRAGFRKACRSGSWRTKKNNERGSGTTGGQGRSRPTSRARNERSWTGSRTGSTCLD